MGKEHGKMRRENEYWGKNMNPGGKEEKMGKKHGERGNYVRIGERTWILNRNEYWGKNMKRWEKKMKIEESK